MRKARCDVRGGVVGFRRSIGAMLAAAMKAERAVIIGLSAVGVLVVVFEEIENETRIISARLATKHERTRYETETFD